MHAAWVAFQTASEIPPGISPPDGIAIVARDQIDSTPENRDTCIKRFNCHAENTPSRKHKEYIIYTYIRAVYYVRRGRTHEKRFVSSTRLPRLTIGEIFYCDNLYLCDDKDNRTLIVITI